MNKNQAIEKIRKCLSLAESANEHEAAAAMRQARKLMEKYGLTDAGSEFFQLSDEEIKSGFKRMPLWYSALLSCIARAFGCSAYEGYKKAIFVGPAAGAEIASYAMDVVLRTLADRKKEFLKSQNIRLASPAKKREMGAAFAEGFVIGVRKVVDGFAEKLSPERHQAHEEYLATKTERDIGKGRERKSKLEKGGLNAWAAQRGRQYGERVTLREGVGATKQTLLGGTQPCS